MCFPTPRRFLIPPRQLSGPEKALPGLQTAVRAELRGRNWIWNCTLVSGEQEEQEEAGFKYHPTHIPVVTSDDFEFHRVAGCNRNLKSEKRGCFWSSTSEPAGSTVNLKWEEVLFKFTHQTRLDKPTRLIIRFVCGFASFSVFIKLNQKKRKWCLHKTPGRTHSATLGWGRNHNKHKLNVAHTDITLHLFLQNSKLCIENMDVQNYNITMLQILYLVCLSIKRGQYEALITLFRHPWHV